MDLFSKYTLKSTMKSEMDFQNIPDYGHSKMYVIFYRVIGISYFFISLANVFFQFIDYQLTTSKTKEVNCPIYKKIILIDS